MRPPASKQKIKDADLPTIAALWKAGATQTQIGEQFGHAHHTTVRYHLCRLGLIKEGEGRRKRIIVRAAFPLAFHIQKEPQEHIKTYEEYLAESNARDHKDLMHIIIGKVPHHCVIIEDGDAL